MHYLTKRRTISGLGESGLVKRIIASISRNNRIASGIVVPNGDDAAVISLLALLKNKHASTLAVSTDMLVEGVHFDASITTFEDIGFKAISANISDMAAMGGASGLFCVACLAAPVDINVENVDKLLSGMSEAARKYKVSIVGGDTVRSPKGIVISITIFGAIERKAVLTRGGAKRGDLICVTGSFGDAAAGHKILLKLKKRDANKARGSASGLYGQLVHAFRRPRPRLFEAAALSAGRSARPTAMMDSSDGLAACARGIADASGLRAVVRLEDVPVSRSFLTWSRREFAAAPGEAGFPWKTVLEGGEEYELVFTVSPAAAPLLMKKAKFSVVGRMTRGNGAEFLLRGKKMSGIGGGYENF